MLNETNQTSSPSALEGLPVNALTRQQLFKVFSLGFFPSIVTSMVSPFLTVYLAGDGGYTVTAATSVVGAATLFNSFIGLVAGRIVDRFDRTLVARCGLLLIAMLPLALVTHQATALLFVGLTLYSLGSFLFDNAATVHIYAEFDDTRARVAFSYYYAAHNCGLMLAPGVVYLVGSNTYAHLFAVALALHVGIFVWFCLAFPRDRVVARQIRSAEYPPARDLARYSMLLILFLMGLCYSLTYQQYFSNVPLSIGTVSFWDRPTYPLLVSLNGVLVVLFQQTYIRMTRRFDSVYCLRLGVAVLLTAYFALLIGQRAIASVFVYAFLFTLAEVLINLSVTDLIVQRAPEGSKASWLSMFKISRLTSGVGIATGGAILAQAGAFWLYAMLIVCTVPMLVLALLLRRSSSRLAVRS